MIYQAIANDVSGIFFFNYHNEVHSNRATDNPEGWLMLSAVAHELQALMPALLASPSDAVRFEGPIMASAKDVQGEIWVMATNPCPNSCNAKLILPGAGDKATAWDFFDAPACRDVRGSIEIEFEPYGVRAMRLMLT